ncbi:nucleotidyltransferase [Patescibacteria group bacterium]|nr:nucleotidyltransferase [Patescibacteria group bacterium]
MSQEDPKNLLVNIAKILKELKIPYIITGGMAVLVWGRPRFTADIDIVVELGQNKVDQLEKALLSLSDIGYFDKKAVKEAINNKNEFNFIDGNTGIKVDFWVLSDDSFDLSRLKRRKIKKVLGENIYFSSPEDLILIKLKWYKESLMSRQIEDVESILKISNKKIDFKYLKKWARKLSVLKILEEVIEKL